MGRHAIEATYTENININISNISMFIIIRTIGVTPKIHRVRHSANTTIQVNGDSIQVNASKIKKIQEIVKIKGRVFRAIIFKRS